MKKLFALINLLFCLAFFNTIQAQTTGTVFRDFNGNGLKDTNEPGMGGVIVNVFNASEQWIASFTTSNTSSALAGNYSIPFTGSAFNGTAGSNTGFAANALNIRLEFALPATNTCGSNNTVDYSTYAGTGATASKTSVRFITGGSTGINFGIQSPDDYNTGTATASVVTSILVNGDPTGGAGGTTNSGTQNWFVNYPYTASGTAPTLTRTLNGQTIGTTWGIAYSKPAKKIFAGALVKRHSGLGVSGSGAIYLLTPSGASSYTATTIFDMDNNSFNTAGTPITRSRAASTAPAYGSGTSFTLNNSGTNSTQLTYLGSNDPLTGQPSGLGVVGSNVDRGLNVNATQYSNDPAAFDQVGKVGLGNIEISDDGKFLFVVNLYQRKVFRLELNNAANPTSVISVTEYALPVQTCTNGVQRPFGIKYYRKKLYVGSVCTGENGGVNTVGGATNLYAYVYELNNPKGAASFTATPLVSFPLNYAKGGAMTWTTPDYGLQWYPWVKNTSTTVGSNTDRTLPQPILADIEFSDRGDLIMSFLDRGGNQWGENNYINLSGTSMMKYAIGGDLIIAGLNCAGTYTLENNGNVTSLYSQALTGSANNQGVGTGEFFSGDTWSNVHQETTLGGLAMLKGSAEVFACIMDPTGINTGGSKRMSTTNGAEIASSGCRLYTAGASFGGKSAGLGDVELITPDAPIEIGNRVWNDANGDGVQNAGEAIFNGLTVQLYANGLDNISGTADDVLLGTTTTSASGEWYFNAGNVTDGDPNTAGNQAGPQPNYSYNVRVATPVGYQLTKFRKQAFGAIGQSDNDAVLSPLGVPMIVISTGELGQNDHSYDFGFKSSASIGDKVWLDNGAGGGTAADGVQNGTEPGVAGITVTLFNNAGAVVGYTITDAYGNYLFDNLAAGNYTVGFTLPPNYTFATQTNTTDDGNTTGIGATGSSRNGSDVNSTTGRTYTIVLSAGENNRNIDAGLIYTLPTTITQSIGDRVWLDNGAGGGTAADGTQNGTEPGVAGVNVTLYNAAGNAIAASITDANGYYLFTKVAVASNYSIGFSLPVGMVFSPGIGLLSGTTNSDANPVTGRTVNFNIASGNNFTYVDAGIYPQSAAVASVGDRVWEDTNQDGVQNTNEPGIEGVTVNLYIGVVLIASTKTDMLGYYMFTNLLPGNYIIEFVKPVTHTFSPRKTGSGTAATDSDPYPGTGRTATINLKAGDRNTSNDAGMYRTTPAGTLKLGDKVWNDYNRDGIQSANEPPVAGITVTLYQNGPDGLPGTPDDVVISTTSSDANGNYVFVNLAASAGASTNYNIQFGNVPVAFGFSQFTAPGSTTSNDSNPFSSGRTGSINLTADNLTIDGGISSGFPAGKGSIGDKVWYDLNNNGIQNTGELGVSGVTVTLQKDINGDGVFSGGGETAFAATTTDALGKYMFGGLDAASYRMVFSNMPVGYVIGIRNAPAGNFEIDSDGDNAGVTITGATTSTTAVFVLAQGEDNLSADLGLLQPASRNTLGDFVWDDKNSDGLQTVGETGVQAVMVTLYNNAGTAIAYTVSDENGQYLFTGLVNGNYSVGYSNFPAGYDFTTKSVSNDLTGSDADILSGRTANVTLNFAAGGTSRDNRSLDAGLVTSRATLGNYVWLDNNGDGVQDAAEKGISGVTVILYASDGTTVVASTITDQNGRYLFSNLVPGSYVAGFETAPGNLEFTQQNTAGDNGNNTNSDANPVTGKTSVIVLTAGEVDETIDAGIRSTPVATVGDYVWSDLDLDGIQDANEPGISGMVVTLYNSLNQPIGSAVTDGSGKYLITNVPPGTGYYVTFGNMPNNPSGVQPSFTTQGPNGGTNTSHANAGGVSNTFTVLPGDNIANIDAGIRDYTAHAILPLQQIDVSAALRGTVVTLNWLTKNEINTNKFIVERSIDNSNFFSVGETAAAGTYAGTSNYSLNDDVNSLSSYKLIYYRIKVLDFDGKFMYSKVVVVRLNSQAIVKIWPNPVIDNITVSLNSPIAAVVHVRVTDATGKTILVRQNTVVKGANQLILDYMKGLPTGFYNLEILDESGIISVKEKIMKQ